MSYQTLLLQRLKSYPGRYECHITMAAYLNEQVKVEKFTALCTELGAHATIIVLETGLSAIQPMLGKVLTGSANEVLSEIERLVDALAQQYPISRIKIEADIDNKGIPALDHHCRRLASSCYFESHIKMCLPIQCDISELKQQVMAYGGYLSKNALSHSADKQFQYRFVTQRLRYGKENAMQAIAELVGFLQKNQIQISKVIREFNIFDSNADLDKGWIDYDN